jgi:hypothetical protein
MLLIFLFLKGLDALALEEAAVRVALIHTAFFITGGGGGCYLRCTEL